MVPSALDSDVVRVAWLLTRVANQRGYEPSMDDGRPIFLQIAELTASTSERAVR
jgi:hypothetical protein